MSEENHTIPPGYSHLQVLCQEVKLFESHVEIVMPNGIVKSIGLGDFAAILSRTIEEESSLKTVLLPPCTYLWGYTLIDMKISCYYPGSIRKVEYRNKHDKNVPVKFYNIPFPNVVINHTLKKKIDAWEHQESRYYATSKTLAQLNNETISINSDSENVWALPLPNIFPEGRLCYGDNVLPRNFKDNFRPLHWHFATLYNSPFNDDLRIPSATNQRDLTVSAWFEQLSHYKSFPYELLKGGRRVSNSRSTLEDTQQAELPREAMDTTANIANGTLGIDVTARVRTDTPTRETLTRTITG